MLHTSTLLGQIFINGSKKIAFIAALILTVGISSSFATPNGGGHEYIKASFHRDFAKAELISMDPCKNFTKLTFKMNDVVLFAFYNETGELVAVTRNISSSQLPIRLLMDIKNDYSNYWITDLVEMTAEGQNSYYVTLENGDKKITLRSNDSNDWEKYNNQ